MIPSAPLAQPDDVEWKRFGVPFLRYPRALVLVPTFPLTVSEQSDSELRNPPGPPLEGHPAAHKSAVPCAPPEMFHAGVGKRMDEVISGTLVKNCGIRGLDEVIKTLESKDLPAEKHRVLWLLHGSPPYRVLPHASGEQKGVMLVPREEWPNHRSIGMLVVCNRVQGEEAREQGCKGST